MLEYTERQKAYDCVRKKESVNETSPLVSSHTLSTVLRFPEIVRRICAAAGASATVDGKRASSTHAMAKPTLKATSRGSTRGKIVPRHFRHNHLLWG